MTESTLIQTGNSQVIDRGALPVAEVVSRVRRIQEMMKALMKDGTHYGTIPGTPKPTLYQPGAELLCMTFRVAPSPTVEDLSTEGRVHYRITMRGVNQSTGEMLGEGVGECSSSEEKYSWRRPVCPEEFADAPVDLRREKWVKGYKAEPPHKIQQVRINPADIANTVLKMGAKRALVAMTRVVLACSDIFAQDLEDLPEEIRESVVGEEAQAKPAVQQPQRKSNGNGKAVEQQAAAPSDALLVTQAKVCTYDKKGKDGEPTGETGTFYAITFSDGREASTFDTKIYEAAEKFRAANASVEMRREETKPGKFKLVEIMPAALGDGQ